MKISLIVAASKNNVIGAKGSLPWKMPADMAFFKRTTMGHCVIMGRKTFASLKRPLVGRQNIVISHHPQPALLELADCRPATSLSDALEMARSMDENEAFIIGGASIYQQALPGADRIYLTRIETEVLGDTYFSVPYFQPKDEAPYRQNAHQSGNQPGSSPDPRLDHWSVHSQEEHPADERNPFPYRFVRLDRVPNQTP